MSQRLFGVVALVLLGAACAGRPHREGTGRPANIIVEVVNDNYHEARVHAVHRGRRQTLGTIAGNGGRTQKAIGWEPRALVFEVSFIIDGSVYLSHPVDVSPGESIELRLPANIEESGLFRRVSRN